MRQGSKLMKRVRDEVRALSFWPTQEACKVELRQFADRTSSSGITYGWHTPNEIARFRSTLPLGTDILALYRCLPAGVDPKQAIPDH